MAANGVCVKLRSRGATLTSFGSIFYAGKKNGKSNYTDFVYENAEAFELWVNSEVCEDLLKKNDAQAAGAAEPVDMAADLRDATPRKPTVIVFKNIGPEEMLARCDPDRPGRIHWSACRAEAP